MAYTLDDIGFRWPTGGGEESWMYGIMRKE
jgi:hypothetical protein